MHDAYQQGRDARQAGAGVGIVTLTRPSKRLCPACQCQQPIGWFSVWVVRDSTGRLERVEAEVCKKCR